jgi:uroporphyrinogen decarboxylase
MRQAGRSLPEYRSLRERHSILDICRTPELTVEVTLQPIRRMGVDAAILFSDIVVPLAPMGIDLDIVEGVGPVVRDPIRTASDATRLNRLDPSDVSYVTEAVGSLVKELRVPLIGFAGAPFTLASYLVEGGPSKSHSLTKAMMLSHPDAWATLMEKLAASVTTHLRAQIDAGASAVQLFDSWVGALSPEDFRAHVKPYVEQIFAELEDLHTPRIYFGVMTSELLPDMATTGADVVGVDWRIGLDEARRRTGGRVALQGNLDPAACLAPRSVLATKVRDVLERGGGRAHVFNLGHGVLPETEPEVLRDIVEMVHEWQPPVTR